MLTHIRLFPQLLHALFDLHSNVGKLRFLLSLFDFLEGKLFNTNGKIAANWRWKFFWNELVAWTLEIYFCTTCIKLVRIFAYFEFLTCSYNSAYI